MPNYFSDLSATAERRETVAPTGDIFTPHLKEFKNM